MVPANCDTLKSRRGSCTSAFFILILLKHSSLFPPLKQVGESPRSWGEERKGMLFLPQGAILLAIRFNILSIIYCGN